MFEQKGIFLKLLIYSLKIMTKILDPLPGYKFVVIFRELEMIDQLGPNHVCLIVIVSRLCDTLIYNVSRLRDTITIIKTGMFYFLMQDLCTSKIE